MSTRSTIAMLKKDGSVEAIYCHSDGYLSYNGEMLFTEYTSADKVKELVSFGDMSSLNTEVSPPEGQSHSFDSRYPGVCVFYGRDRGEDGVKTSCFDSLESYLKSDFFQEYDYVFNEKKNSWYLINQNKLKLEPLATKLLKDNEVSQYVKDSILSQREAKKLNKMLPQKPTSKKVKV